jgi:hypothetical protein
VFQRASDEQRIGEQEEKLGDLGEDGFFELI